MRKFYLTKSRTFKNGLWIILERIFSVGVSTVITVLSARYLGAENFGTLSYGASFVALFLGVMRLGIDSIIVNELIKNKGRQGEYLGTSIVLRLASSALSILAIFILSMLLNFNQQLLIVVTLIQSLLLFFQTINVLDYWFQSRSESKYVSIAKILATIFTATYSVYLLISGKDVIWFSLSTIVSSLVVSIALIVLYKRQGGANLSFSFSSAKYLLSKSHHFIIANIISLVYIQIDRMMVGNMLGTAELGVYSAAITIITAWAFFPDAIITSLRPGVIHAKEMSESVYLKKLKQLYFIIFWVSVVISLSICIAAPVLVELLFGVQYAGSVAIVQISVWYVPLSMLGMARNIWLVSESKQNLAKYILMYGLVINIILNLILIPIIGLYGAAITTVITEMFTCFIAPLFYKKSRIHTKILLQALVYKF